MIDFQKAQASPMVAIMLPSGRIAKFVEVVTPEKVAGLVEDGRKVDLTRRYHLGEITIEEYVAAGGKEALEPRPNAGYCYEQSVGEMFLYWLTFAPGDTIVKTGSAFYPYLKASDIEVVNYGDGWPAGWTTKVRHGLVYIERVEVPA